MSAGPASTGTTSSQPNAAPDRYPGILRLGADSLVGFFIGPHLGERRWQRA